MSSERLPVWLEVSSLIRRAESAGGFGMILARGDPDRGAIVLLIADRGAHVSCLERQLASSGRYEWQTVGPEAGATPTSVTEWTRNRRRIDPDTWLIELDVPRSERFIAETTSIG